MIVLDTHALLWWVSGDKQLSTKAQKAIENEQRGNGQVIVSAITAWEIAMLASKGQLVLSKDVDDWLATVDAIEVVEFAPVTQELAVQSVRLPGDFHPDPADRMIVALARHLSASLVTADSKIRAYRHVKTIW
ncbi:twitching motility protein PilT [Acidihalobacter yilgarnensis]|uniref:Twitching motility protein PilT n=1 Tax=Acidihalobacter yilgarnensis TaxID=2819280 RepID=A0A1D8IP53_9GAMM|nr:type II toxin-antitoxin system VapC family toxin [Acidihalobacter yilgarnensis]AOU98290.1 twitching motility protein PilT [Acidihalobacter yilgarnensis]